MTSKTSHAATFLFRPGCGPVDLLALAFRRCAAACPRLRLRHGALCRFAIIAAVAVAGCAPQQSALNRQPPEAVPEVPEVAPPDVALTAEMLAELVVSEMRYQRGDIDRSIEQLTALALETKDYRLARSVSRRAVNAKRYDIARRTTALWVEVTPHDSFAWWIRGVTQIAINDFDGAVESFGKTLEFATQSRDELFADIARAISGQTDPEISYSMFSEIASQYPDNATAYKIMVRFAVASGENQEVVDQYIARAYELDPQPETALIRFSLYLEQEREEEAVDYIERKIVKYPDSEQLGLAYSEYLVSNGRVAEALKHLRTMPHSSALLLSAELHYRANKLPLARKNFIYYAKAKPDDQEALLSLAKVELDLNRPEDARLTLDRITDRELQFQRILLEAEYASVSGRLSDGIRVLDSISTSTESERVRIYVAKQGLFSGADQWQNAKAILDQAIEEHPNNIQLRLSRSFVVSELGMVDAAESDLRRVLSQNPHNVNALNALGYTLTDLTDRHGEALQLIEQALNIRPHDPYILDSMGWVQYKLGNMQEALDYLIRAYSLRLDPVIAAHLGEVYWVLGDQARAQKVWKDALAIDPENRVLQTTVQKFTN